MTAKRNTGKKPLWTRDFAVTSLSNLLLFFSFQLLIPTIPLYAAGIGGGQTQIGLAMGTFTVASLLTRPFAGKALDTIGRKHVLSAGLALCGLAVLGYSAAAVVAMLLALRFIHGIGWGISTTSLGTVISDIIPSERRGEGMGIYGLSNTMAMALAPLTGLWIAAEYGFHPLFIFSTVLAFSALLLSLLIRPGRNNRSASVPFSWREFRKGLIEPGALLPSLLLFFTAVCYGGIVTFLTLFGKEAGIGNVGWFFVCNAVMLLITRPLTGLVYDRKGPAWVLYPGAFFTGAGLWLLSYAHSAASLAAAAAVFGAGFGSVQPALLAWTIDRTEPSRRGAANGTFYSANDLGIGTGSMLLGAFASLVGSYGAAYRWSVLLIVLLLVIYSAYLLQNRRKSAQLNAA
ncbi:MFS transporter [Paenibacillus sp. UNC499MF]|uniref:MFS transporter n=1 Tax=Paenibacillus sp. UNC499MF TaxID=1502751 RepID=UPI00089FB79F|nr:MFS transporter [Paenibacillus sp. UNC499MF]SEF50742.1 Predicted arabinose efflux permease, MFS family [Paenibacillus sp. UNC499MF]